MFNTLRSYVPSYSQLLAKRGGNTLTVQGTLPVQTSQSIEAATQSLEYKNVCNVVLITEVDDIGQETPIAIAFVDNQAMVSIHYLQELSEIE